MHVVYAPLSYCGNCLTSASNTLNMTLQHTFSLESQISFQFHAFDWASLLNHWPQPTILSTLHCSKWTISILVFTILLDRVHWLEAVLSTTMVVKAVECGKIDRFKYLSAMTYMVDYFNGVHEIANHHLSKPGILYTITLNGSILKSSGQKLKTLIISFTPWDRLAHVGDYCSYVHSFADNYNETIFMRYIYYKTILLEHPYKSQCFNYKPKGLESQGHCFQNCLMNSTRVNIEDTRLLNLFVIPYPGYQAIESMTTDVKCTRSNDENRTQYSKRCFLLLRKSCSHICKQYDCIHETFNPVFYIHSFDSKAQLILRSPVDYSTIVTYTPQIDLIEFITYALSCISFWLGWSPLEFLIDYDFKCKSKCYIHQLSTRIKPNLFPLIKESQAAKLSSRNEVSQSFNSKSQIHCLWSEISKMKITLESYVLNCNNCSHELQ